MGASRHTVKMDKALQQAIEAAGGTVALADKLGLTHQAVSRWDKVPPLRVLEVEAVTGVSRYDLRPDVYGKPHQSRS